VLRCDEDAVYSAFNVRIENGSYLFDIKTPKGVFDLRFGLPGKHNLMNALMAAMAQIFGTPIEAIALALASFKGVKEGFRIK
jgi:UDP-N-acetylmuramate--alanine ligase